MKGILDWSRRWFIAIAGALLGFGSHSRDR